MTVTRPEALGHHHDIESFTCGIEALDNWLKRRALKNQITGASRTFVVCEEKSVVGYYALASSAVAIEEGTGRFRRNMPDPIPVVVLGRLAVHRTYQGSGTGRALVRDAALRVMQAADTIGIRGMITHAISTDAKAFYAKVGFESSPLDPLTMMITLADLHTALSESRNE